MSQPTNPSDNFSDAMWAIMDRSRGDESKIKHEFGQLEKLEFVGIYREFFNAKMKIWIEFDNKGVLDQTGISDDGKHDIYSYVVSLGKEYYNDVFADPTKLNTKIEPDESPMIYVPVELFYDRFDDELFPLL